MTPIVTSRIAVTTVAAASFWNRVTDLLGDDGSGDVRTGDILAPRPGFPCLNAGVSGRPYAVFMHLPTRLVAVVAGALLVVAACGSTTTTRAARPAALRSAAPTASFLPQPVTSDLGVGPNRILYGLLDSTGTKPIGSPDRTLSVGYTGPERGDDPVDADDVHLGDRGLDRASMSPTRRSRLPASGSRPSRAPRPARLPRRLPFSFDVQPHTTVLSPGDAAPSVKTPTLSDVGGDVAKISTDTNPVERFYETSEADALAAKKPFVLIFATPKFCQPRPAGPRSTS